MTTKQMIGSAMLGIPTVSLIVLSIFGAFGWHGLLSLAITIGITIYICIALSLIEG